MTLITRLVGFSWLPASPRDAWLLDQRESAAANARILRDNSVQMETSLDLKACFRTWNDLEISYMVYRYAYLSCCVCDGNELLPAGGW